MMKIVSALAALAVVNAQAPDVNATYTADDTIIARRPNSEVVDIGVMTAGTSARLSAIASSVERTNQMIAHMRMMLNDQNSRIAAAEAGVASSVDMINREMLATTATLKINNTVNRVRLAEYSDMVDQTVADVRQTDERLRSEWPAFGEQLLAGVTAEATQLDMTTQSRSEALISTVQTSMSQIAAGAIAPLGGLTAMLTAMQSTHYTNKQVPVYRWMMFHVYSNNNIGWFDGNNPRFFGGRNPSNWGDGNARVQDMSNDINYIARLFTRRGVGASSGATVCSETWYLYSSTDTKYCIALFRIKNTRTSAIQWRVNWHGTGWSGWGNQQSITNSGQQNWAASCTWWCHRVYNFNLLASSTGDRISTLIFANGNTHPNHYADNHHIMATFLGFDNLQLPAGLEYVDDLATASGRWR